MAEEPRITRFKIDWGGNQSRATQEEQQAAAPDQNTEVDFSAAQFEEKKATNYWFSLKIVTHNYLQIGRYLIKKTLHYSDDAGHRFDV